MSSGKAIRISVFSTGDRASANEPRLVSQFTFEPVLMRLQEGKEEAEKRNEARRHAVLAGVKAACEDIALTQRSPILLGVKRAVEYLKALQQPRVSTVYVKTDGEENVDPPLQQLLRGARDVEIDRASKVNNEGVRVVFCGASETIGSAVPGRTRHYTAERGAADPDRMNQAWRSMFSAPELVSFTPFCTGS